MGKRIYWRPQEIRDMAEHLLALKLDPNEWGFIAVVREKQKDVLPPERRRPLATTKDLAEVVAEMQRLAQVRELEDAHLRAAEATAEAQRLRDQPPSEPPPAPKPVPVTDYSFDVLVRALVQKAVKVVMEEAADQMQEIVTTLIRNACIQHRNATPQNGPPLVVGPPLEVGGPMIKPPPRERKPKVVVVGLLRQQTQSVEAAFQDRVEFEFVKSQDSGGSGGSGGRGMVAHSSTADVVISMTRFVQHDVENRAKDLKCPFIRINGGVSWLKRWINHWLETGELNG